MKPEALLNEIDQSMEDIVNSLEGLYDMMELACESGIVTDSDFNAIYGELQELENLLNGYF